MSNTYLRGSTFLKYLNILRVSGSAPDYPSDYSAPTFSIMFKNGTFSVIVPDTTMTQGLNNVWFFTYSIPNTAPIGTYLIKYKVTIDGIPTETTEDYLVSLEVNPLLGNGTGSCVVADVINDEFNSPVGSADIFILSNLNPNVVLAHTITDSSGNFIVNLDPGDYYLFVNKPGFVSEERLLTVNNDCTHTISTAVPVPPQTGQWPITDTVESTMFSNLEGVDVFVYLPTDTVNAIAHSTTDVNGQFTVHLDTGSYVVLFSKQGYVSATLSLTVDGSGGHIFS